MDKHIYTHISRWYGFQHSMYYEGAEVPDCVEFSLLDIRKRNSRARGKRKKNGNLKRTLINKTVWTLGHLSKIIKSRTSSNAFEIVYP